MNILIRNGQIINAEGSIKADILCKNGLLEKIGQNLASDTFEGKTIDAKGKYIFPGGIDPHVHLHLPTPAGFSADDFESGSKTAIAGGTTSLIDFVTPKRGQSIIDALYERKKEASDSLCNVKFHVSPVEWTKNTEQEIIHCIKEEGIQSFKVYMAYQSSIGLSDEDILKVMKVVGKFGGIVIMHCEIDELIEENRQQFIAEGQTSPKYHPLSRPNVVEANAVKKAIELADKANCPLYIVHVSTHESLEYIKQAQDKEQAVFAETCPQYLLLDDSVYNQSFDEACKFVMSPPLRKKEDQEALWQAIKDGVIQTVGTDHCPFTLTQKRSGISDFTKIPNGAGGIEHRMSLLFNYGVLQNRIPLNKYVQLTSANAANIFGNKNKGCIKPGMDADLIIWDTNATEVITAKTHQSNCDLNIYEGFEIKGKPCMTIINGKIVTEH